MKIKELKEKSVRVEEPKCNRKLTIIALIVFMALCIVFVFVMAALFQK